ncbi:MAG: hypothetical protein JNK75_14485, partial [Betaproteobacteria bacterium]|nr:hypothetical protein [Betaproteobacteria bacterium]
MSLLLIAAIACNAFAQPVTLIESPVKVTAEARAGEPAPPGNTVLTIEVQDRSQGFRFQVAQRGKAAEAIARQKAVTGFKDGHLFIRDDCQADTAEKRTWRCVLDKVFAWAESHEASGKRLIYVGDVHAGEECESGTKVGCALFDGQFTDIYDQLENIVLATPATAPQILIEMSIKSGDFVVDLEDTWGRNQERYKAGAQCLAAPPETRAAQCTDGLTPRRAYLFNMALATY